MRKWKAFRIRCWRESVSLSGDRTVLSVQELVNGFVLFGHAEFGPRDGFHIKRVGEKPFALVFSIFQNFFQGVGFLPENGDLSFQVVLLV